MIYEELYKDTIRNAFGEASRREQYGNLMKAFQLGAEYKWNQAEKVLNDLLPFCRTQDDYGAVLMMLAICYTKLNLPEKAIESYRDVIRHDETRSEAWSNMGILYSSLGKLENAVECYESAIEHNSKSAFAYNNLATAYHLLGEHSLAVDRANMALKLNPKLYQASNTACIACCALERYEESEVYFKMSAANGVSEVELRKALNIISNGKMEANNSKEFTNEIRKAIVDFRANTAVTVANMAIPAKTGKSRLGGESIGKAPFDENGNPMRLLAAIYCSEIHNIPDLPPKGILQFYIADNENYGMDFDNPTEQKNFRVIFTEDEDFEGSEITLKSGSCFPITGRYNIQFNFAMSSMSFMDYRFEKLFGRSLKKSGGKDWEELNEDVKEALFYRFDGEGHKVGGYPCFCQYDPRDERPELQKYDTLLLQIDSQEGYIEIGDSGVMNFFIPKEKLKAGDFTDILYWWDCY